MIAYLVRRVALAFVSVVAISFTSFWVIAGHLNPLSPLLLQRKRPTAEIHRLTILNHLDKPLLERYFLWVKGVLFGGDGRHTAAGVPIWQDLWYALRHTLQLAGASLLVALALSVLIGTVGAAGRGGAADRVLRLASYLTWSTPTFLVAYLVQAAWNAWHLNVLYTAGVASGSGWAYVESWYRHMTLPVLAVALSFIGLYSRYVRTGVLSALDAPHITAARAKGVTERRLLLNHALRNALVPFLAVATLDFSAIVSATLVVDVVFQLRGLGTLLYADITSNEIDPFELQALVLVMILVVVVGGLLADALYPLLDPRIRIT